MVETIEQQHQWLVEHPDELTRYPGEFIAIAGGKIVAHGKVLAKVIAKARKAGYEPLLAKCFRDDVEVIL